MLVDAISTATPMTGTSAAFVSWAHTVAANANRLEVFAGVGQTGGPSTVVPTCTYGGVSMTLEVKANAGSFSNVYVFYLDNPTPGTANIVVTWSPPSGSNANQQSGVGVSFIGATLGAAAAVGSGTANPGSNGSFTIAGSQSGDECYGVMWNDVGPAGTTTEAGTLVAEQEDIAADSDFNVQRVTASGANTALSWTHASDNWAAAGVALRPGTMPPVAVFEDRLMGQAIF